MSKRILGIDYGLVRIGLAISDEMKMIASPLETFKASKQMKDTVTLLLKELEKHEIAEIVVGLPLKMSGQMGLQADEVMAFVKALKESIDIPIITWDERLTSVQAERLMRDSGMSRKKRAQSVDRVAATIILQSYLDSR